jgi:hypothetical protein
MEHKSGSLIADRDRFNSEADEFVRRQIPSEYLAKPPEEYAARHGHNWLSFSLHRFRYRDQQLGNWVRRLGELLDNRDELEQVRQRLLSPEELEEVRRQEAEEF